MAKRKKLVLIFRSELKQLFVFNAILRQVGTTLPKAKGFLSWRKENTFTHWQRDCLSFVIMLFGCKIDIESIGEKKMRAGDGVNWHLGMSSGNANPLKMPREQ